MSRLLLLFFSLTLASCSTLQEVTDDDDSSIGYTKAKNEKGQSVYKRTRIIKTAVFPMPTNTTVPSTSIKNSPTKITHKKLDPAKRDLLPQTLLQNKPSTNNKPQDKSFHGLFELSSGSDITHIGVGFNYEFGSNLDGK
ncbi:MAG: hypothetical protein HON90_10190, partial [Halobacteriovoraceae bacterium]|nr:hypothetical protein [Halobacteriovoraceae bacterium]